MNTTTILLVVTLAIGGVACEERKGTSPPVEPSAGQAEVSDTADEEPPSVANLPATDAGEAIASIDASIAFHRKKAAERPGWMHLDNIANAYMARARLTGSVDDYLAAREAIEKAFEAEKTGADPHLTRATFHFTTHQVKKVERDLAAYDKKLLIDDGEKAALAGLRGDVALQTGELDEALERYRESEELRSTVASAGRLGTHALKTGRYDDARQWYERAAERAKVDDGQRAWALLHRGIVELEVGDVEEAEKWYRRADEVFSGWFLVEEHIAEARLLQGEPDEAIEIYESVIARVPNGEFMAAMAEAYEEKGDDEQARSWRERAREAFERDLGKLPTAASGHALEFFLDDDPGRALELARANFETRPGHEARTLLAHAFLANGKAGEAREVLEPVAESDWATLDFLAAVAVAFEEEKPELASRAATRAAELDEEAVAELRSVLRDTQPKKE